MSESKQVVHHTNDDGFNIEVSLVGLNYSVVLKSNCDSDSIENLLNLGLSALSHIKSLGGV